MIENLKTPDTSIKMPARSVFRNPWYKWLSLHPVTGLVFLIIFTIIRYALVINAAVTGSSKWLPFVFILMILIPFILLNKDGRKLIGLKKPTQPVWMFYAFLAGFAACLLIYAINLLLFQKSLENALVYISRSYEATRSVMTESNKSIFFVIYALIAMTISPFGEEIFFRGFIHQNFAHKWSENHASDAESIAFAITHLIHFGFVFIAGHWSFYFAAAMVWLASMYVASKLFFFCREKAGSVYGAVAAHSGFNLAMTGLIFYNI